MRATGWLTLVGLLTAGLAASSARAGAPCVVFDAVWRLARDEFFDPGLQGVDWDAAWRRHRRAALDAAPGQEAAAVNALLAELRTSHTRYYPPDDPSCLELLDVFRDRPFWRQVEKRFPGGRVSYAGIGVATEEVRGRTTVRWVLDGSPAARAGLEPGDRLLAADGRTFHPLRAFEGKVGTSVTLLVRGFGGRAPGRLVPVVPVEVGPFQAFLDAEAASVRVIDRRGLAIGYVHVWSYAHERFHQLLVRELSTGRLRDAEALVLDLRDGWGGADPRYLNLFGAASPRLEFRFRDGSRKVVPPEPPARGAFLWERPVALLVNGGTRSGKEVLAHAFQRQGLGPVVGAPTAGAVVGGRPYFVPGGGCLYLAVADVTLDGEHLEGRPVRPDVPVAGRPGSGPNGRDPQLEGALEALSELTLAPRAPAR